MNKTPTELLCLLLRWLKCECSFILQICLGHTFCTRCTSAKDIVTIKSNIVFAFVFCPYQVETRGESNPARVCFCVRRRQYKGKDFGTRNSLKFLELRTYSPTTYTFIRNNFVSLLFYCCEFVLVCKQQGSIYC